jgi:hypothetical protein
MSSTASAEPRHLFVQQQLRSLLKQQDGRSVSMSEHWHWSLAASSADIAWLFARHPTI